MTNVGGVLRPLRTAGGTIYTRAPKRTSAIQDVTSNGPGPVSGPRAPGSTIATKSIVGPPLQFNAFKQNIFSLFGGVLDTFDLFVIALFLYLLSLPLRWSILKEGVFTYLSIFVLLSLKTGVNKTHPSYNQHPSMQNNANRQSHCHKTVRIHFFKRG